MPSQLEAARIVGNGTTHATLPEDRGVPHVGTPTLWRVADRDREVAPMARGPLISPGDGSMTDEATDLSEGPADSMRDLGKYVYCIAETDQPLDLGLMGIGAGDNPVYTVHHGDLAAVVSDTPLRLYDPTRENVLAHELVNEAVMREHTVIPMSFGTIFRTDADVVELLRSTGTAFSEVLTTIRGKFELGLKVVWDRDKVVAELEDQDDAVRGLKKEISNTTTDSTYFARVQLGRLVEGGLEARANELVNTIYGDLRPLSVATRGNKLIGDNMILNAAFLVERTREEEFDAAVKALSRRYVQLLSFKYTGPWPPYNFVNIKLKLERAEAE